MTKQELKEWAEQLICKPIHILSGLWDHDTLCIVPTCILARRFLILLDLACSQEGTLFEVHHAVERLEEETEELEGWYEEAMDKFKAFLEDPDKEIED